MGGIVYFVRHGDTGREHGFYGERSRGIPLSPLGQEQASRCAVELYREIAQYADGGKIPEIVVCVSPTERTRRTAEKIITELRSKGLSIIVEEERGIVEIDVGEWDGKSRAEVTRRDGELLEQYDKNPGSFTFPNGESIGAFQGKVVAAVNRKISEHQGKIVIFATHMCVIRAFHTFALNRPLDEMRKFSPDNTAISKYQTNMSRDGLKYTCLLMNRCHHIAELVPAKREDILKRSRSFEELLDRLTREQQQTREVVSDVVVLRRPISAPFLSI